MSPVTVLMHNKVPFKKLLQQLLLCVIFFPLNYFNSGVARFSPGCELYLLINN